VAGEVGNVARNVDVGVIEETVDYSPMVLNGGMWFRYG
jgi:hypothetical protein